MNCKKYYFGIVILWKYLLILSNMKHIIIHNIMILY